MFSEHNKGILSAFSGYLADWIWQQKRFSFCGSAQLNDAREMLKSFSRASGKHFKKKGVFAIKFQKGRRSENQRETLLKCNSAIFCTF